MTKSRWTWVSHNLNNQVRVKLTSAGHKQYKKYLVAHHLPTYETRNQIENEEGWSTWELWELMNIFGKKMYVGFPEMMFENNEIQVEKEVDDLD